MYVCHKYLHHWMDEISAKRCCNGWHRKFTHNPTGKEDPHGLITTPDGVLYWEPDNVRVEQIVRKVQLMRGYVTQIFCELQDDRPKILQAKFERGDIITDPTYHFDEALTEDITRSLSTLSPLTFKSFAIREIIKR